MDPKARFQDFTEATREDGLREFIPSKPEMTRRQEHLEIGTNGDTFTISFSSENPVIDDNGDREILSHEASDALFTRLAEVGSILKNHDPEQIVGVPVSVELDPVSRKGRLTAKWGTTPLANETRHEVEIDKTLRGVSVGFIVKRWIWLERNQSYAGGRIVGPAWVATKWEALEASLTPIPADPAVGVNRTTKQKSVRKIGQQAKHGDNGMKKCKLLRSWDKFSANDIIEVDDTTFGELTQGDSPVAVAFEREVSKVGNMDIVREREEAAKAERSRVSEISALCSRHGLNDLAKNLIENGTGLDEARKSILAKLADGVGPVGGSVEVVRDGAESFRSAAIDGVLLRSGAVKVAKPVAGANDFRGMSLVRLAEECLRRAGVRQIPSDARGLVQLALRGESISGTSSDFPLILSNVANKSLLDGFATAPTSYQFWAAITSLNDFKATQRIKFSEVGKLKLVPEGGKYSETALTEKKETIQLGTYGRVWTMSRQAIINDDLDAFSRVPASFGMQAAYLPNDLAISVLTANAAMTDGNALFSAAHGNNSAETDRRLDTVAHAQAAAVYMYGLMAQQQTYADSSESDGKRYLNLRPRVWLVAGTDEIIARQSVVSAGDAGVSSGSIVNPIGNLSLQVVADQNIKTSASDYSHYMFADPRIAPVVEVAFLQGNQQPYFERMDESDSDGSKWLIRLDCGAAAVDHVGAVREVGTDA